MNAQALRVALFPDAYHEIDGVANTSRQFAAFAKRHGLPFLIVHAGPHNEIVTQGSLTRIQLRRSKLSLPLDRDHKYDLLFFKHYRHLKPLLREFNPDVIHITGPSDLGSLGALLAHKLHIPLAASWQTNLHLYARTRLAARMSFCPKALSTPILNAVERWSFRAAARFYHIPRLLFAPNPEVVELLERATGKPCSPMPHSVDTAIFSPAFRDRKGGPFRLGYVGRLTAEKNVRTLARLEQALLARGHREFRMVIVGGGAEEGWLRKNMTHAEFTGVLTGRELSRAYANLDLLVFPSETDTFGLVVLEALASGVPAVVTARGGPKYTVQNGRTGYVADNFDEFVACTEFLLTQPDLVSSMRTKARDYALSTSWEPIFEGMYNAYEQCLHAGDVVASDAIPDPARLV